MQLFSKRSCGQFLTKLLVCKPPLCAGTQTRSLSLAATSDMRTMIPEYNEASKLFVQGDFSKAVPVYKRAFDIINHAMGSSPHGQDAVQGIAFDIGLAQARSGNLDGAESWLQSQLDNQMGALSVQEVRNTQLLCLVRLLAHWSEPFSGRSVELLAQVDRAIVASKTLEDNALLVDSCSLKGLALLMLDGGGGELAAESAEDSLLLAARTAVDNSMPVSQQVGALNNLAYATLARCQAPIVVHGSGRIPHRDYFTIRLQDMYSGKAVQDDHYEGDKRLLEAAAVHLGEALEIGGRSRADFLQENLKGLCFFRAFCTTLHNMAVIQALLGDRAQADKLLSEVLDAATKFDLHCTGGASTAAAGYSQLLVGKALVGIACSHMESAQAVSAEGLFRSALDKFGPGNPFANKDPRGAFERAVALYGYGKLLTKWEKREVQGVDMMRQSDAMFGLNCTGAEEPKENEKNAASVLFPSGLVLPCFDV